MGLRIFDLNVFTVRRMMRLRKTRENFDSYLNETHLDRIFAKSLQEKTEYKAPLRNSNNGGTEMLESLNRSQFHLVCLASANPYQRENGTTFETRREFILDVRLNYTPVHLINWILVLNTFIFVVLLACFFFIYIWHTYIYICFFLSSLLVPLFLNDSLFSSLFVDCS
ncbi:hypothetical protein R3W88_033661 [Solanum pinnatisectum]|uniref:Uncharacterized protein n=1 Tax=Solanum pinnatisectum TaxID=50273 RepID=A0AAV9K0N8_9SOLN|nr:hypothetical protein R3W88_033661 [Solanum pinnatisectum]